MKRLTACATLVSCGLILLSGCASSGKLVHFGEPTKLTSADTVCVGKVLADKDKYTDKYIRVTGTVKSVCAHKGCWIRLGCSCAGETLFVKFSCPVEGRLVPMEAKGRTAIAEGTFIVKEISEQEARHYEEDGGASPEEIAKIVGPQKQVKLSSPAALIDL